MDHLAGIARGDFYGRMLGAGRGAADQERNVHAQPLHFTGDVNHLFEAGGNQPAEPDHIGLVFAGRLQDLLAGDHHAQVDDLVIVAAQHDADDVLADVVHVALDGGQDDRAAGRRFAVGRAAAGGQFFRLHEGHEVGDGLLHHACTFHDLREEHLAVAKEIADDLDSGHERPLDDVEAGSILPPALLDVRIDIVDDAVDEGVLSRSSTAACRQAGSALSSWADLPWSVAP